MELLFHLDGYRPEHTRERLVPNGRMNLVVALDGRDRFVFDDRAGEPLQTCRGAWLSGVHTEYLTIGETSPENRLLVVQFSPGGSVPFTHTSADTFCDRVVPATEVFGPGFAALQIELEQSRPADSLTKVSAWLEQRFDPAFAPPPPVREFLDALLENPANCRPTEFVERRLEISHKHFIQLFRRHVGPTPKTMQRILRFQSILASLQDDVAVDWPALSHELGFADQAHLIREFRRFSGYRAAAFHAEGHDRVNFFPDDGPG